MKLIGQSFVGLFCFVLGLSAFAQDYEGALRDIRKSNSDLRYIQRNLERYDSDPAVRQAMRHLDTAMSELYRAADELEHARRVIVITKEGKGGTTHNDRQAACSKAQERALEDAQAECFDLRGRAGNYRLEFIRYYEGGEGHICRYNAHLECEIGG